MTNMLYGLSESHSCHLSKISRALKEKISLKKTIERLFGGFLNFSSVECLTVNYINTIKRDIDVNYAISDGIFSVRSKSTTGIFNFIFQPHRKLSGQMSFLCVTVT